MKTLVLAFALLSTIATSVFADAAATTDAATPAVAADEANKDKKDDKAATPAN